MTTIGCFPHALHHPYAGLGLGLQLPFGPHLHGLGGYLGHAQSMCGGYGQQEQMLLMQLFGLLAQVRSALEGLAANPPEVKPTAGQWLVNHGHYKSLGEGRYEITDGELKGCHALHQGEGRFLVTTPEGFPRGCWQAPTKTEKLASPLTFDLNGDGKVGTTGVGKTFDIDGDGKADKTAWAGKGDGVLAFDADGDGKAGTSGRELFGNNTDIDGDGKADGHANGFEALSALAKKHLGEGAIADGKLDQKELSELSKKTGLRMLVDGQSKQLDELGISELKLGYSEAGKNADENGNEHRQVGAGFVQNGETRKVADVWFRYQKA
ncbi:MAG: VCBS repeat-containing protein [Deltaproteobacteria bacterium]|nr:VCBS repeat-containing protein [Deltaproteobacteria bacterium]